MKKIVAVSFFVGILVFGGIYFFVAMVAPNGGVVATPKLNCSPSSQFLISKYQLESVIFRCSEKVFTGGNGTAALVLLDYYPSATCNSSGAPCLYSRYCAIVEGQMEYPYMLRSIDQKNILGDESIALDTVNPQKLSGRNHWLTTTAEFVDFMAMEAAPGVDGWLQGCK